MYKRLMTCSGLDIDLIVDFVSLPNKLYKHIDNPQSIQTELAILKGNHALSKEIKVMPFVTYRIYEDSRETLARCLVTTYKNDENAYIGFFESINDLDVAKSMFDRVEDYIKGIGKTHIVGPVDASFWIRYRFKKSGYKNFYSTYTGEPYNLEYYTDLWLRSGYKISEEYESNFYRRVNKKDKSFKLQNRLKKMREEGFIFKKIGHKDFDKSLEEIYNIIKESYKNFPVYKHVEIEQFREMFSGMKCILNKKMTRQVYKDGIARGFIICLPNYGTNNFNEITFNKRIKFLINRIKPKEYVIMYMGITEDSLGLGSAIAEDIKNELCKNRCTFIGALIHKGKITSTYYKELILGKSEYVLLEKDIASK